MSAETGASSMLVGIRTSIPALTILLLINSASQCSAQTPDDIKKILQNSKGLEKTRPLKVIIHNKDSLSVSTYSHPKASDSDCRINSLLIMKDLVARYKTLQRMSITFYDPKATTRFRTVRVTQDQVLMVDKGRPVGEVLSEIDITHGASAAVTANGASSAAVAASSHGDGEGGLITKLVNGLKTGKLPDSLGPYELDRQLITQTVWNLKAQGQDMRREEQNTNELNILAAKGDSATLSKRIPEAFQRLHITQSQVVEWHRHNGWRGRN